MNYAQRGQLIDNTTRLEIENTRAATEAAISTYDENSPFAEILAEYRDITVLDMKHTDQSNIIHQIITTGPPVFCRPRRISGDKLNEAKAEFQFLM